MAMTACIAALLSCLGGAAAQDYSPYASAKQPHIATGYTTNHNSMRGKDAQTTHSYALPEPMTNPLYHTGSQDNSDKDRPAPIVQPTRLEEFYRAQTGDKTLSQFGYDLFSAEQAILPIMPYAQQDLTQNNPPMGAVQDDYILQSGDDIHVVFMGERKDRQTYRIESDGRLLIDDLPPITATGKSLGAVRKEIQSILQSYHYNGDINVSVSGIRQIGVLIAGHVEKPGRHNMNAFHSVIDALQQAGGIRKTGSLRQIKLIRQGQTDLIDLYALLVDGRLSSTMQLQDGDRLIVPPVGPTIAVTGDVKQPAIFELRPDPRLSWRDQGGNQALQITLAEALRMAGGILSTGENRFTLRKPSAKGAPQIVNMAAIPDTMIGDGGILTVTRTQDIYANAIALKGYSRKNGLYDLHTTPTLSALLSDRTAFGDDIYPLIGVIDRMDRDKLARSLIGFSPKRIVTGREDQKLMAGDAVYLFSHQDIADIIKRTPVPQDKDETEKETDRTAGLSSLAQPPVKNDDDAIPQSVQDYIRDSVVTVQGAVRHAGAWPVGSITDMESLIAVAGGLTTKADHDNIEIVARSRDDAGDSHYRQNTSLQHAQNDEVALGAGDQIRVNEKFEKAVLQTVRLTGEVKNPGNYDLMRGDTLSSVIRRAGGLTDEAYAPGAIFSRAAERKREEARFRAAAQDLERTISVNLNATDKDANLTPQQISMARDLADELRNIRAVGRVTVEADPAVLQARPELDLLMEGGDHLHIPKRPLNVRVSGEVMNPASLLFTKNKGQSDYIAEAGGLTYYADKSRIFIVYPDGSARPVRNLKPDMIIPGSTIIVPRDPKPFNFIDSFKDITQILANLAITGVFINDIADD